VPTLETPDGRAVDVTAEADAINAQFDAAMNGDVPGEQAPPRRAPKPPAAEGAPKPRRGRPPKAEQARTADKPAEAVPAPPSPALTAKRASSAEETFRLAGTCLLVVGKITRVQGFTADGFMVNANAAPLATALADVAAVEPQIARWLDKAPSAKVSAWMGLASVAAGLGLQAAANHKLIKPGVMGTSDPADIIRANEEAIAAQQKALEDEAAELNGDTADVPAAA
jgi:hypothetical protein